MDTLWSGRLIGTFLGYKSGRVFGLSDGSSWRQEDLTDEPLYRDDPAAWLLSDRSTGTIYLDVEGTSAVVRVHRAANQPRPAAGAF
jgi:hypothetical protein